MNVQQRWGNQQNRINNGMASGQMDGGERGAIRAQRQANGARFREARAEGASPEELKGLRHQMLNGVSGMIWEYKHN